jgi:hypothetical protein
MFPGEFKFEFVYNYALAGAKKSKATNDMETAFRGRWTATNENIGRSSRPKHKFTSYLIESNM